MPVLAPAKCADCGNDFKDKYKKHLTTEGCCAREQSRRADRAAHEKKLRHARYERHRDKVRSEDPNFDCLACLLTRERGQSTTVTRCGHKFHTECLQKHVRKKTALIDAQCPWCRAYLTSAREQPLCTCTSYGVMTPFYVKGRGDECRHKFHVQCLMAAVRGASYDPRTVEQRLQNPFYPHCRQHMRLYDLEEREW